ncbi:MAG TPA: phage tail protein [Actinomycetota bacterium]|nr:phage tail protein [Actinomycetota bacterium]
MPGATDTDPAVALYFHVRIDGVDLGEFTTCDGLSMDVVTEERVEGGNNGYVWKLPVRITFSNVRFTRPIGPESIKVASWLAGLAKGVKRTSAEIVALTPQGNRLVTWHLTGVIPVKWSGPSFSAESPKVAEESLEIAHNGFTLEAA